MTPALTDPQLDASRRFTPPEQPARETSPPPEILDLEEELGTEFFEGLAAKGSKSVLADQRWVYEVRLRFRAARRQWERRRRFPDGGRPELEKLRAVLAEAPGLGAVTLLFEVDRNPKEMLPKITASLSKTEDEDEAALRSRSFDRKIGLVERLIEAGSPRPPWFPEGAES